MKLPLLALLTILLVSPLARAQADQPATPPDEAAPTHTHPTLPESNIAWPAIFMIVVAGMFLCAMIIGPLYRSEIPDELPPTHSHDEPPGTSHHHGPGGTVQPGPEHDLPGGHASGGH